MSRWKIDNEHFDDQKDHYTAVFTCTDVDKNQHVVVSLTQNHNEPASNLIGALRALAQLLLRAATVEDGPPPSSNTQKLN